MGAVQKGGRGIVTRARQLVPRDTGALRKSLGVVVKKMPRTGKIMAFIGARRSYYSKGKKIKKGGDRRGAQSPAHYSHLVEFGHRSGVATGRSGRLNSGQSFRSGTLTQRSYVLPRPFLRPAFEQMRDHAHKQIVAGFNRALEIEYRRARRRFTRKLFLTGR